jgi:SRSO17 transposase
MYVEGLVSVIGHADRAGPLEDYCMGLLLPAERKSVEPMARMTAPERTAAQHQSLLHFVGQASWSDEAVLNKVRELVLLGIERHGPIEAWRMRIRIAKRDCDRSQPWPEEWLLIEWPEEQTEPTKYRLSTLPADSSFRRLVNVAKLRCRIERDYLELKQEVGLGHFEGRGWRGFHHHASLHRSLWIPDLRTGDHSTLGISSR